MTLEETLANRPQPIQKTATQLKKLILDTLPDLNEHVYGKKIHTILYSKENPNQVICGIQTSEKQCLLFLHKTEGINTTGLKLEGKGKSAKHVKYNQSSEIDGALIKEILRAIYEQV